MFVLVVDDQAAVRTALSLLLDLSGVPCLEAERPEQALQMVREQDVGAVVQDMNFSRDTTSGDEGVALFRALRALDPELPVILLTAWTSLQTAVQLVKEGAHDYLAKPWDDDKLTASVLGALRLRRAETENLRLRAADLRARDALRQRHDLRGFLYRSRPMHELLALATRVAPSDAPVLITGPNGAGKERIAEIVQANSRRAARPFVQVNAGGLPDGLLEAELFGAEAGAYTGATRTRVGRFEAADGGTLFLDELGNLSLAGQMKLLRVLQTGEYQRLGSPTTRRADVRLISATNSDLPAQIAAGGFREDLYYRLNVIELELPALARRSEDILPLADHFLRAFDQHGGKRLTPSARAALEAHEFPGNVRELENRIRRAVLVSGDAVSEHDLGLGDSASAGAHGSVSSARSQASAPAHAPHVPGTSVEGDEARPAPGAGSGAFDSAERAIVEAALQRTHGVVSRAAAELGISRQALYRRMDRLGVAVDRKVR